MTPVGMSSYGGGTQYDLDPTSPITLVTDYRGKVTVSAVALGLHTAQLTFTAGGQTCVVYPPQNVQDSLLTVSSDTVTSAQSQSQFNQPAEPMVSSNATSASIASATTAANDVIQIKNTNQITGGTILPPGLDLSLPRRHALRLARSATVIAVHPGAAGSLGDWDSFWDDLVHAVEDLFQAIRRAVITVTDVVVTDIEQGVIEFTAWLGDVASATLSSSSRRSTTWKGRS
jgi:hypothetical protein